jgi:predicted PhzF superfamily epimerase YddE/YHI9
MRIPFFRVNAFTADTFGGNSAGVCLLEKWLPDAVLQNIAAENGLSETAFVIPHKDYFRLRWMTPTIEVDLCGHATLATAFVLFTELGHKKEPLFFETLSGRLSAAPRRDTIELNFPSRPPRRCPPPQKLVQGLGLKPAEVLKARDYVAVFHSESEVQELAPDVAKLAELDCLGIIVTAPGKKADFVSRFFAPRAGIAEDPVTGSAHCSLIPFWSERLGKSELLARQLSRRGGELYCRQLGHRVGIGGRAVLYCRGELEIGS